MRLELLFNGSDIHTVIQAQTETVKKNVQEISPNQILNANEEELIQALVQEYQLNVPVLKEEEIYISESGETQVDVRYDPMRLIHDRSRPFYVPGNKTVIAVPFDGDAGFFKVQPQTYTLNPPQGTVSQNEILLTYVRTDHNAEAVKQEYQRAVASIKEHLSWLSQSGSEFNRQLEGIVRSQVTSRKQRLLADMGMTQTLGLPLKKRHGVPTTYSVPVKRKPPAIDRLPVEKGQFKPEPTLANEDYEEILRIIKNMVKVMELSPRAFQGMNEEDLRTHFLVQLNGQYEGQATAETFNFQGKTDILIRAEGRNVFVAECKFWKGELKNRKYCE